MNLALEIEVLELLRRHRYKIIVLESCTGGLISHRLTSVAGSSDAFWGGVIVYDNEAKVSLAGVPREMIATHGAVSSEVASALSRGGVEMIHTPGFRRLAISTTGVAGPDGGTAEKPVGLCYLGLTDVTTETRMIHSPYVVRNANQDWFAAEALTWVRDHFLRKTDG